MILPQEWMPCLELAGILSLEAGLIVGVAFGLERCTRSALWPRAIWQAAMVALSLLLLSEFSGLARDVAAWAWSRLAEPTMRQASLLPSKAEPLELTSQFRSQVAEPLARHQGSRAGDSAPRHRTLPALFPPALASLAQEREMDPVEPFLQGHSMPWAELAWAIGMGAALGTIWLARLFFLVFHQRRQTVFDGALLQRVASLARSLGIRRRVRVFESARLAGPVAFGVVRPMVGLPKEFTRNFSIAQQEVMLAHELAHLAGHDPAWHGLADIIASVLWWHPLVWWARQRLRAAAETAADEASLLITDGPGVLAECLLRIASWGPSGERPGWLGVTGNGFRSGLGRRIERLVLQKRRSWTPLNRIHSGTMKLVVPLALVAAAVLCTAWVGPQKHGDSMKTIRQTWKRSVATLALFAAFGAEQGDSQVTGSGTPASPAAQLPEQARGTSAPAATPAELPETLSPGTLLQDARLLMEMGKLDEAEGKLLKIAPQDSRAARYLDQIRQIRPQRTGTTAAQTGVTTESPGAGSRYQMDPRLMQRYGLTGRYGPQLSQNQNAAGVADAAAAQPNDQKKATEEDGPGTAETPAPQDPSQDNSLYRMDPRLLERYGLRRRTNGVSPAASATARQSRGRQQVEAKLNEITLNEILYDGLPLSEIVRDLNEQARKRDPEKRGINFLISNMPEKPLSTGGIDPVTGQPIPAATTEDLGNVPIKIRLRNVSLKDVLDAMTRITNPSIKYSVEDYGVVFSPGAGGPVVSRAAEPPHLQVRTFRVDTNTFLAGLESAFGISVPHTETAAPSNPAIKIAQIKVGKAVEDVKRAAQLLEQKALSEQEFNKAKFDLELAKAELDATKAKEHGGRSASARDVQQALRQLLQQLGINMDIANKAVFYNDLTGIVMVRATPEDLQVVQAAMETLGGNVLIQSTGRTAGGMGTTNLMRQRYEQRYGMGGQGNGVAGEARP